MFKPSAHKRSGRTLTVTAALLGIAALGLVAAPAAVASSSGYSAVFDTDYVGWQIKVDGGNIVFSDTGGTQWWYVDVIDQSTTDHGVTGPLIQLQENGETSECLTATGSTTAVNNPVFLYPCTTDGQASNGTEWVVTPPGESVNVLIYSHYWLNRDAQVVLAASKFTNDAGMVITANIGAGQLSWDFGGNNFG